MGDRSPEGCAGGLGNETGSAATISTTAGAVGKTGAASYTLTDLWSGAVSSTSSAITASVPAHGTVMYRVSGGSSTGGTGSTGEVRASGAGKCLDVPNSTTTAGTQVEIWDCNGGANQTWTRTSSGRLTVYSGATQLCLDAYDNQTTPGTKVETWPCDGQPNQQWQFNTDGTIRGTQSGLCLDVTQAATSNGTPVELWTCNGAANQQRTAP